MIIHKCDRCGRIIDRGEDSLFEAFQETIKSATEALVAMFGKPIPELIMGSKDAPYRDVDLCTDCRVSFRKWYRGGQPDEIPELDEERPAQDAEPEAEQISQ